MKAKRPLGLLCLGVVCALGVWWARGEKKAPLPQEIQLAGRTCVATNFPTAFAVEQTPTARGTALYALAAAEPVTAIVRKRAEACGARVLGFLPPCALTVEIDAAALRRLAQEPCFAAAAELTPADKVSKRLSRMTEATLDLTVVPLQAEDRPRILADALAQGAVEIGSASPSLPLRLRAPRALVAALARRGDVRWIEPYALARLLNDVAVNAGLLNARTLWNAHGLTGAGEIITLLDTGLDTGNLDTLMPDFSNRVCAIRTVSGCSASDFIGHGTHVAGSLVGSGALSDGQIRGVAHGARLYVWQGAFNGKLLVGNVTCEQMFRPDETNFPSRIASESWGIYPDGSYTSECAGIDLYLWQHPGNVAVFAAGNSGNLGDFTICDPATAKNVIAVGATESLRTNLTAYAYLADNPAEIYVGSSRGPTGDGRIKPDVCAPGTMILSTRTTMVSPSTSLGWDACGENSNTNEHYFYNGGTSMATPLVAGAAALVREDLRTRRGIDAPTAALVKALLTGGAQDLSVFENADCSDGDGVETAPNNRQGWGRVDVGESLYPSNRSIRCFDRIPFDQASDHVVRVTTTRRAPLDVQLAWIDYPGDLSAVKMLVNDLDLVVSNETTGVVWWGNGIAGGDHTNTVEGVRIADAPAAHWAIHVKGVTVPYSSAVGGAAALYARGVFPRATIITFR